MTGSVANRIGSITGGDGTGDKLESVGVTGSVAKRIGSITGSLATAEGMVEMT
jgi:hypothetical protein